MKHLLSVIWGSILIGMLTGCKAYKQDILFRLDEQFSEQDLSEPISQAERNYQLLPDDQIQIDIFTNDGERLIDPNFELSQDLSPQNMQFRDKYTYLVQTDGVVKLPIVGKIKLSDLTVDEAEQVLETAYNNYYKGSFVKLTVLNRRVIVLGANGGQVIPLQNENTSLIEVIALYGGLNLGAKATNIKVIRGELSQPQVFQVDLSTIDGMKSSVVMIESGDVIYIEPWRRPWLESIRDISPALGLATSILTLIVVIQNFTR